MKNEPLSAKFCSIVAKCLRKREPRQIARSLFHKSRSALSVPITRPALLVLAIFLVVIRRSCARLCGKGRPTETRWVIARTRV